MASFIFEEGSQIDASGFTSSDTLIFKAATPTTLGVSYDAGGTSGLVTTAPSITLTFGTQTLKFAATSLSGNANLTFLNGGGTLEIGTTGADTGLTALSASGNAASAVYALDGGDAVSVSGKAAHVVDAGAGNDTITANGVGNYVLSGGDGNDTIDASATTGNLHIYGGTFGVVSPTDGADSIIVGQGDGTTAAGYYVNGNGGNDTITIGTGVGTAGDTYRLQGGAGNDSITVAGEFATAISSVNGNTGNDIIHGGAGTDYLRGGQGDDTVIAGGGNAQLFGDVGNDSIVAGAGINVLTGGTGNDVFVFGTGSANTNHLTSASTDPFHGFVTEIKDFTSGSDTIDLVKVTPAGPGTPPVPAAVNANILLQASGATFTTESAAQVYAQQLIDNHAAAAVTAGVHDVALIQVGGDTYLFSVEGGGSSIDTVIKLDGVTAANVKAADFV